MGRHRPGVVRVDSDNPHPIRRRQVLRDHPEVRRLSGRNPWTAVVAVALVALQLGAAAWAATLPWWAVVVVAWVGGAFVAHALFAVLHECAHNLVFPSRAANQALALFVNLPLGLPTAASYTHYHRLHHRVLGEEDRDPDLPAPWEARLARGGLLGKLLWNALFPVLQVLRVTRLAPPPPAVRRRVWLNTAIQLAFVGAMLALLGPKAVAFAVLSLYFTTSLHPLAGRLIQEHHVVVGHQETYSYYGVLNWLSLNLGYHNEHHDFPGVSWNRLPALRRLARTHYDALHAHRSWTALWLRALLSPTLGPLSRVTRVRPTHRARGG